MGVLSLSGRWLYLEEDRPMGRPTRVRQDIPPKPREMPIPSAPNPDSDTGLDSDEFFRNDVPAKDEELGDDFGTDQVWESGAGRIKRRALRLIKSIKSSHGDEGDE